jgi:hypothetical protein
MIGSTLARMLVRSGLYGLHSELAGFLELRATKFHPDSDGGRFNDFASGGVYRCSGDGRSSDRRVMRITDPQAAST